MNKYDSPRFHIGLLHPRYWPAWIGVTVMYVISWLPYPVLFWLGCRLGRLMMKIMSKRRHVIERNLELSFPECSQQERDDLVRQNIDNNGLAMVETCIAWFWPTWRLRGLVEMRGMAQIEANIANQRGSLLIAYHNLNLEICAQAMGMQTPGYGVYRPNNNPAFDYVQYRGRVRHNKAMIHKRDIGGMINALKTGGALWYMPDHDYGPRRSVFVPYFAVQDACTTTGTSILADAAQDNLDLFVVHFRRNSNNRGYICEVVPIEDFPFDAPTEAAATVNRYIEAGIRKAPAEYMWLHRRFKTRPKGQPSLYGDKDPRK